MCILEYANWELMCAKFIVVVAMEAMLLLLGRTTSMGECEEGEKEGLETSDERKKLLLAPESDQGRDEVVVELGGQQVEVVE